MRHLVVAPNSKGFGETLLGVQLAGRLIEAGHEILFVAHESAAGLIAEHGIPCDVFADHVGHLLPLYLQSAISRFEPDSLILADCLTTSIALQKNGLEISVLKEHGLPIVGIDTWDSAVSGSAIDVFGDKDRVIKAWTDDLSASLVPVPFARLEGGGHRYSSLPTSSRVPKSVRAHVRSGYGLSKDDKLVLFCTASWQHAEYTDPDARKLAKQLPQLLGRYLRAADDRIRVIHVGPQKLEFGLGSQYYWLPPVLPQKFESLLSSADLLMLPNISSTTIGKALQSDVPILVPINSHSGSVPGKANGSSVSIENFPELKGINRLYPFRMWPLGYYDFLDPVFADNPYTEAIDSVEVFQPDRFIETVRSLLGNDAEIEMRLAQHRSYVEKLAELPSPVSVIEDVVGS